MKTHWTATYAPVLERVPLFAGIHPADWPAMFSCLNASVVTRDKNEFLLREGEPVGRVGIVLAGQVQVVREDYLGRRTILAELDPGELFAEVFACAQVKSMPVSVLATTSCAVLFVAYARVVAGHDGRCPNGKSPLETGRCRFAGRLTANMLAVVARKNLALNAKLETLEKRTTRERVLSYLAAQAKQAGNASFTIPFTRQELADYLSVDRSALSAELSRMQQDGLLRYHRSEFTLL